MTLGADGDVVVAWRASHVIPRGGLSAWAAPDPTAAPASRAAAGLKVRILETTGAWAHVEFTNGWTAWVDGRALRVIENASAPSRISVFPAAGAALILLGSFLPWLTAGNASASAWDIPVWTLLTHHPSTSSVKVGVFLLIPLIACVPYVTRTPFRPALNVTFAGIGTYAAMGGAMLTRRAPGPRPGIGLAATALGGLAIGFEYFVASRAQP